MRRVIVAMLAALLLVPPIAVGAMADTTPGGGPDIPVSIEITSAKLMAKGAGVQLGVDLVCEAGPEAGDYLVEYGTAEVRQAVGRKLVAGYAWLDYGEGGPIPCGGEVATHLDLLILPESAPFKSGQALGIVWVCAAVAENYQSYGCADEATTIRISRK